jgi:hypothetical protein
MTTTRPLHLLLSHADDHQPALPDGLTGEAAERADAPAKLPAPTELFDRGRDPNDLALQRWGLIVPEGEAGDRLAALVEPLVAKRHDDQGGHPVQVYRVPPKLDAAEAAAWHRRVYLDERVPGTQLPFYQLILGDLDQVPLAVQQVQMIDGAVGRLAFPDHRGYEAYVAKLLRWERAPAATPKARSMFFTVHDGTGATTLGYEALVAPALAIARRERDTGDYAAGEVIELGDPHRRSTPDELLGAIAAGDPAVLFSVSHGEWAPLAGWTSIDEQRRIQGAMNLGSATLSGADLAAGPVLPGGIWFMLACYSAGTPDASVYRPWLESLRRLGEYSGPIDTVLRSLPRPGERPFIARLPASVLANPDGPIAFLGHVDLAWSYGFQEIDAPAGPINRQRRFTSLLHHALRRDRVGVAFRELVSSALAVETELLALYGRQAAVPAAIAPAQTARLGHLWMLRQDLLGYILLGDPAARLPITPAPHAEPRRPTAADLFPFAVTAGTAPPAGSPALSIETLEQAIAHVVLGDRGSQAIADSHGIDRGELERLAEVYRAAGRAALARPRGR